MSSYLQLAKCTCQLQLYPLHQTYHTYASQGHTQYSYWILYCLKLQLVSYKRLFSFSGQGKQHYKKNKCQVLIKCQVFSGFVIKYIFTWTSKLFLSSFFQKYDRHQTVNNRAPSCNKNNTTRSVNKFTSVYGVWPSI